jgi:hypothetical protein
VRVEVNSGPPPGPRPSIRAQDADGPIYGRSDALPEHGLEKPDPERRAYANPSGSHPSHVVERIRTNRADEHGNVHLQPIPVDEQPGYICRHCLEDPAVGESVYLFSYSPFDRPAPYRSVGPIFVHTTECRRYGRQDELPMSLRHRLLSFRAYRSDDRLVTADVAQGAEADGVLGRLFQDAEVAYVDIHNARPGCFKLPGTSGVTSEGPNSASRMPGHSGQSRSTSVNSPRHLGQ